MQVLAPLQDYYWQFVKSASFFTITFVICSNCAVLLTCTLIARAQLHDLFRWWSWIGSCGTKFDAARSASPWCGSAFSLLILFSCICVSEFHNVEQLFKLSGSVCLWTDADWCRIWLQSYDLCCRWDWTLVSGDWDDSSSFHIFFFFPFPLILDVLWIKWLLPLQIMLIAMDNLTLLVFLVSVTLAKYSIALFYLNFDSVTQTSLIFIHDHDPSFYVFYAHISFHHSYNLCHVGVL